MKGKCIRKGSLVWWAREALKWTARFTLLGVIVFTIEIVMIALYADQMGLPMPWEGLI